MKESVKGRECGFKIEKIVALEQVAAQLVGEEGLEGQGGQERQGLPLRSS